MKTRTTKRATRIKFNKPGPMLIAKAFWGLDFMVDTAPPDLFREVDGVAVVDVCGPLTHHDEFSWFGGFESYDHILECALSALESNCKALMLRIDSPGGDVAGCFETARAIRAAAAAAGKPVFAYVDGMAASGGYALACAATTIGAPETAFVGSIGVIETRVDVTAADAAYGQRFTIVTSGARKADGNPHSPTSDAEIAVVQADVDSLAAIFHRWVSEARGISVDEVAALEAGIFHGDRALAARLVDVLVDEKGLLALASGNGTGPTAENERSSAMGWKEDMYKAAEGGDDDAKSAIAHLAEQPGDDDKGGDKDKPKGEGADPDKDGDKDKDKDKPAAAAAAEEDKKAAAGRRRSAVVAGGDIRDLASVVREVSSTEVRTVLATERRRAEVVKKIEARTDLVPEKKQKLVALATKSIEQAEEHLDLLGDPKPGVNIAAADFVAATDAEGTSEAGVRGMTRLPKAQGDDVRERMGLGNTVAKVFSIGTKRFFPSLDKKEASALLERNQKAADAASNGGK